MFTKAGITIAALLIVVGFASCDGEQKKSSTDISRNRDTLIVLKNDSVTLKVSRFGGAFTQFEFNDQQLNPLDWRIPVSEMPENNKKGAPFQGHFLCLGRWGSPTEGEIKSGIPHNGEPSNNWWKDSITDSQTIKMKSLAPLEQWEVNRKIKLSPRQALFEVEETFTNLQNTGRFTTIVQHATLGGAFLDENTVVNTNAGWGFNQSLATRSLSAYEYQWPNGFSDTLKTNLNLSLSKTTNGYVTTHVIDDPIGWATASNPSKHLLIGYVWKREDYPWLHIWHGIKNGKPWAKGIEFGTTGIGDTYPPETRATLSFHGWNNNRFVDALGSVTYKYYCFLVRIPSGSGKTVSIKLIDNQIEVVYVTDGRLFTTKFITHL